MIDLNDIDNTDVFEDVGVEILLAKPDDFLKVKETLTRMGITSFQDKVLYQSCHILHKRGHYAIVHFKELFKLDHKPADITDIDIARRNTIANLLDKWKLCQLKFPEKSVMPVVPDEQIKIIPHRDKKNWRLSSKYAIGIDKRKHKSY